MDPNPFILKQIATFSFDILHLKKKKKKIRKLYQGTCYNPKHEVYQCDNLQPIHRNDSQDHKLQGCSLHTHNPVEN